MFTAAMVLYLAPLYAADVRTTPIDVNLIIDGSAELSGFQDQVASWISTNLMDQLLQSGDTVTVWSAGASAKTVYSQTLRDAGFKDGLAKALQGLDASGSTADFAGALAAAASRRTQGSFSYTILVTASTAALSPTLLGPQARLMRFSRIEEFAGWRTVVVGLNIDAQVRQAAAAYFVSPSESRSGT
jgi:hypothetical protein